MYLLTEWKGWTGNYLTWSHGELTERRDVLALWPRAKYFPVRPDLTHSINILLNDHRSTQFWLAAPRAAARLHFFMKKGNESFHPTFVKHVSWNYLPKQTNNKEKRERNILALNTRLQQILSSPRTERDIKKKLQLHLYLFGNCMNLVTFQLVIFVFECRLHHQYICCSFQNVVNIWVPHFHSTVTDQKREF